MPCESDYMAASGHELESVRVCKLLVYIETRRHDSTFGLPGWVVRASNEYYGNTARLNAATAMLCERCRCLTDGEREEWIYDAHDKQARELADWWERHQEWDVRRVQEEDAARKQIHLRERALRKLTTEEMEALGLHPRSQSPGP